MLCKSRFCVYVLDSRGAFGESGHERIGPWPSSLTVTGFSHTDIHMQAFPPNDLCRLSWWQFEGCPNSFAFLSPTAAVHGTLAYGNDCCFKWQLEAAQAFGTSRIPSGWVVVQTACHSEARSHFMREQLGNPMLPAFLSMSCALTGTIHSNLASPPGPAIWCHSAIKMERFSRFPSHQQKTCHIPMTQT